jgi:hypothetical protein
MNGRCNEGKQSLLPLLKYYIHIYLHITPFNPILERYFHLLSMGRLVEASRVHSLLRAKREFSWLPEFSDLKIAPC